MSQESTGNPIEEVVEFFAQGPSREQIAAFHLSTSSQEHVSALLHKHTDGTLTLEESNELNKITALNDVISLLRARVHQSVGQLPVSSSRPTA